MTPEEQARVKIDTLLKSAGWVIYDRKDFDRNASKGVVCREFLTKTSKEADYILFINGKAVGVIEAKKAGVSLSGIETQDLDKLGAFVEKMTGTGIITPDEGIEDYLRRQAGLPERI